MDSRTRPAADAHPTADTHLPGDAADTAPSTEREALVGRLAWAAPWFGVALGLLHALSRYRTEDGSGDLDAGIVSAWADPAGDLLSPLLTWADPDLVYTTYGKLWLPVFAAFTAMAFVARRHRSARRFERFAWRVMPWVYVGACLSVTGEYWTQWTAEPNGLLDAVFLVSLPLVLLTIVGSTVLGTTLLVRGYRPRATAVLLTVAFPAALLIGTVTSMGNIVLPIAFAWGIAGRRLARAQL